MATIKKFEDLDIWKEARGICQEIFEIRNQSGLKTDYNYTIKSMVLQVLLWIT